MDNEVCIAERQLIVECSSKGKPAAIRLVVVFIAEELKIENDSTARFSSYLFFENAPSNEGEFDQSTHVTV